MKIFYNLFLLTDGKHANGSSQVCKKNLLFGYIYYFGSNFLSSFFFSLWYLNHNFGKVKQIIHFANLDKIIITCLYQLWFILESYLIFKKIFSTITGIPFYQIRLSYSLPSSNKLKFKFFTLMFKTQYFGSNPMLLFYSLWCSTSHDLFLCNRLFEVFRFTHIFCHFTHTFLLAYNNFPP